METGSISRVRNRALWVAAAHEEGITAWPTPASTQGRIEVRCATSTTISVLAINATGTWLGMKNVLPIMQKAGHGSIVNVSSLAAIISGPAVGGGAAYSASKGPVRSLTKHAAQWFAKDRIRVNSVHPGPIYTSLMSNYGITEEQAADPVNVTLPPHIGESSDIGYGILYLASDEAKFVTGEELIIDGGYATH
ncbi:SDR family oxidoreductase [Pseudarthrobacter sp. S9]|uniref:SDR family oxidoreductase n=1 Tax=Pseudarthrobacter sp. S9 TaxID=3418421 RepID=UPI003CFDFF84